MTVRPFCILAPDSSVCKASVTRDSGVPGLNPGLVHHYVYFSHPITNVYEPVHKGDTCVVYDAAYQFQLIIMKIVIDS